MTHEGSKMQDLLDQLGNEPVPPIDRERQLEQRRRVVQAINTQAARVRGQQSHATSLDDAPAHRRLARMHEQPSPLKRWRTSLSILGLAASVALTAFGWAALRNHTRAVPVAVLVRHVGRIQVVEGETQVVHTGDSETRVVGSYDLTKGDLVRTERAAQARLTLAADIRVEMAAETRLR